MARVGAIEGMLIACESRAIATVPLVSAVMAVISGSSMPSSDPKAMRMMIAAAMRPMTSLFAGGVRLTSAIALPPSSTCEPWCPGRLRQAHDVLDVARAAVPRPASVKSTVAKAVLPSRLIWAAPLGP